MQVTKPLVKLNLLLVLKLLLMNYQVKKKKVFLMWDLIWLRFGQFWVNFLAFTLSFLNTDPACIQNSKNSSCINLALKNLNLVLRKQMFLKLVYMTIIKWSRLSRNFILQGKVQKQNTQIAANLLLIASVLTLQHFIHITKTLD